MDQPRTKIIPEFIPELDPDFYPAALHNRSYKAAVREYGKPLTIGLERSPESVSTFSTQVFPDDHPRSGENIFYVERIVKFLLWQRGGYRLYIGGPRKIGDYIKKIYSSNGDRKFDHDFLSEWVYEQDFQVLICGSHEVPVTNEVGKHIGRHLDGYRIGFDLGASDRKVSAVINGEVVYSEEVVWEPQRQTDPAYHYEEIMTAIKTAASKMPRVDAVGGSSAGIYINDRPLVASLYRGIPKERFDEIRNIFHRIREEINVPLAVINDGDVTALAGSMSIGDNGVLGIAMGSSEAAGYVDMNGNIKGWLNELAFAPIDYNTNAPKEGWSGDIGVGAKYFSQQCVFRLAPKVGIELPEGLPNAERLKYVQDKLAAGHTGARKIWESMGIYLGYTLPHYADFYEIKHVLILGRCTSGSGGDLILDKAVEVMKGEFPELSAQIKVQLPDEYSRRVGQSIAAASLPEIPEK